MPSLGLVAAAVVLWPRHAARGDAVALESRSRRALATPMPARPWDIGQPPRPRRDPRSRAPLCVASHLTSPGNHRAAGDLGFQAPRAHGQAALPLLHLCASTRRSRVFAVDTPKPPDAPHLKPPSLLIHLLAKPWPWRVLRRRPAVAREPRRATSPHFGQRRRPRVGAVDGH